MTGSSHTTMLGILISHAPDRRLLEELLRAAGYEIRAYTAADLAEREPQVCLVITDEPSARRWHDELFALKRRARPLYIPLLLALIGPAPATPWLRAGFDDVLRVPMNKDDLLARIEAFVRLHQHSQEAVNESARRFQATFDLAPIGIIHCDLDGRILLANPRFSSMLDRSHTDVVNMSLAELIHPEDTFAVEAHVNSLVHERSESLTTFDARCRRRGGDFIWVSFAMSMMNDAQNPRGRIIAALEDISERKRSEQAQRESERFVRSTIDALSKRICVTDQDGMILAVNKAWREFASKNGIPPDTQWSGQNYLSVCDVGGGLGEAEALEFASGLKEVASGVRNEFAMQYSCHSPLEQRWFSVKVSRFPDDGPVRVVIAHENVTSSKLAEKNLLYMAHFDALTGLPNRALMIDRLGHAIAHANRHSHALWVMVVDLDRFKIVNDTLGHRAGDNLLKTIANRMESALRQTDTVARFGGDEFVIILSDPADEPASMGVLNRTMASIAEPVTIEGQEFNLSCSIGIATYPTDGTDPDTLIDHADIAMYRAKELGRNSYQFYTPAMNEAAQSRLNLERHLRNALERNEFVLHFQPQVDLRTGQIAGVEALVRWHHPELGMVAPGTFIGLAEETGLIVPLGEWVMRTACAENAAWQRDGLPPVRVAVNLSARQFAQKSLVQSITTTLGETGMSPQYLDIELTETIVMDDVEDTIKTLRALKDLGLNVSIDDFGTGYSSLAYLRRFPIDVLKIDRSFVHDILGGAGNEAIPAAIIAMAHSLGMEVIAEGVESEAQCEFLSRNMCDQIQGYWFSKPLPAPEMRMLLQERRCLPGHVLRTHARPGTLLIVDDEPSVLSSLQRALHTEKFRIVTASGGEAALQLLARRPVDVILSDHRMAGMTGLEFLRAAKERHPHAFRILLSGYPDLQLLAQAVNEGLAYRFLTKPWDDAQLRRHVEEAFEVQRLAQENRRLTTVLRTVNRDLAISNRRLECASGTKVESDTSCDR